MKTFTKMVSVKEESNNDFDSLIYDLIFGTEIEYNIHLNNYQNEKKKVSDLIPEMKTILKKSKIKILTEKFYSEQTEYYWEIKIKRK